MGTRAEVGDRRSHEEQMAANARAEAQRPWATEAEAQYPLAPSLIDAATYTDPARYQAELEHILLKAWYPACPSGDLAQPRDFQVWDRLRQSVVICRRDDGGLSAWHNVCQHRGARLVPESGHCKGGKFRCPWHGFTYDLSGALRKAPLEGSFDPAELEGLRLIDVRVTEWAGFVWLCLSDEVPELEEYLGDLHGELSWYGMDNWETRFRREIPLAANWKLVVDAFNETWHVPFTHRDTLAGLMLWRDAHLRVTPPHSWMTLPVRDFTERAGRDTDHHQANLCHYLVFPNTIFSCFPTHLQMWSMWPEDVGHTTFSTWGVVGPTPAGLSDEQWIKRNECDWEHFMNVSNEDAEVIDAWSTVSHSKGWRRNMFNTAESRLTAFHDEVARRIGEV